MKLETCPPDGLSCRCVSRFGLPGCRSAGTATVVSSGHTLPSDIESIGIQGEVFMVNHAALFIGSSFNAMEHRHVCSAEPWLLTAIRHVRGSMQAETVSHCIMGRQIREGSFDFLWRFQPPFVTSGMFALLCCVSIGYRDVRVLGIPSDSRGHFYDPNAKLHFEVEEFGFLKAWREMIGLLRGAGVKLQFGSGNLQSI